MIGIIKKPLISALQSKPQDVSNSDLTIKEIQGLIGKDSYNTSTPKGIENNQFYADVVSRYRKNWWGYLLITILSISTSVYGGYSTGLTILIIMAVAIEIIKLLIDRTQVSSALLASMFSMIVAFVGLSKSMESNNNHIENNATQEKRYIEALHNIDKQLLESSPAKEVSQTQSSNDNSTLQKSLSIAATKLITAKSKLSILKNQRHTYWQSKPNKRNRRTGRWMLNNIDKCTGTFCSKIVAFDNKVKILKSRKDSIIKAIEGMQSNQKARLEIQKNGIETKNNLIMQRASYHEKLSLLSSASQTTVTIPMWLYMSMVVMFLLFIESYQHQASKSVSKLRVNANTAKITYRYYVKINRESIFRKLIRSISTRNNDKPEPNQQNKMNSLSDQKVLSKILSEVEVLDNPTRKTIYSAFTKYKISKTQSNYKVIIQILKP